MMQSSDPRFRVSAPANLPAHAWPTFPDFERFPDLRESPPAWWHWYRLEAGRVIEVAGSGGDALDVWGIRTGHYLQVVRTVASGSPEACEAAFRLLTATTDQ